MASRKQKGAGVSIVRAYQDVFGGPKGRTVLYDLMQTHGMLSSGFTGDSTKLIFKEGERNVVLRILTILKVNPADLMKRIEEEHDETVV